MTAMWMVRCAGGRTYDLFQEHDIAAIGWEELAEVARVGVTREELATAMQAAHPSRSEQQIQNAAGQVWRFINEMVEGDRVVTYSPQNRTYLVGTVTGPYEYRKDFDDERICMTRPVSWEEREVDRDDLGQSTRYSLGSTLTVFKIRPDIQDEIEKRLNNEPVSLTPPTEDVDEPVDYFAEVEIQAIERTKDLVMSLDWDEMQELVAGILRSMGYKTQVSPAGPDRGKDIVASPDGFGFEDPRIVVEVKHRNSRMSADVVRSFVGGRHTNDRGLFVSTGGFTKDARYEADRSNIPLTLWTADELVRALVDHYDETDSETKRLVPLKRLYVPA